MEKLKKIFELLGDLVGIFRACCVSSPESERFYLNIEDSIFLGGFGEDEPILRDLGVFQNSFPEQSNDIVNGKCKWYIFSL